MTVAAESAAVGCAEGTVLPAGPPAASRARFRVPATRSLAEESGLLRYVDLIVVMGVLLSVFVATNAQHTAASGVGSFLDRRITLRNVLLVGAFVAWMHVSLSAAGAYDPARTDGRKSYFARIVIAVAIGCLPLLAFPLASKTGAFSAVTLVSSFVAISVGLLLVRLVVWLLPAPSVGTLAHHVLVVGTGPRALELLGEFRAQHGRATHVVGFLDAASFAAPPDIAAQRRGSVEDLEEFLRSHAVDDVLIALPMKSCYAEIADALSTCERMGVRASYHVDAFGRSAARASVERSGSLHLVRMHMVPNDVRLWVKRATDIVGALFALVVLSPVLLMTAALVKGTSPGPVLFSQERYGYNRRRFRMYKFRTMIVGAEAGQGALEAQNEACGPLFKIRNDPRVTPIGRVLRRTSLDELPQLWNVLVGDMSLVGPRPLPPRDVGRMEDAWLLRRFSVRPGITGLWQVSGRSDLPFADWIRLDLAYIDRWSLQLDASILARTLPAVIRGRGAA